MQDLDTRGLVARGGASRAWSLAAMLLSLVVAGAHAQDPVSIVTTVAGGGAGFSEGIAATSAAILPQDVAYGAGNLYILEPNRVTRMDALGRLWTVATQAQLEDQYPTAVYGDPWGNVYIATSWRVFKVAAGTSVPQPYAGDGASGDPFDGGDRLSMGFMSVYDIDGDAHGNVYLATSMRVWRIGPDGIVHRIAGIGGGYSSGDGGPALDAGINPQAIDVTDQGFVFLVDSTVVRRITPDGMIDRITGTQYDNDPLAYNTHVPDLRGIAVDPRGNLIVSTWGSVRMIDKRGAIKTFAANAPGMGNGFSGDGGPAMSAQYREIGKVAVDPAGNAYIVDSGNARIRKVTPTTPPVFPASAGAFAPPVYKSIGAPVIGTAIADVNGDGRNDALVLTGTQYVKPPPAVDFAVHVYLQQADRTLPAQPLRYNYPTTGSNLGGGFATGDLNKDGKQDVIVGTHTGISIFPGTATGLGTGVPVAGLVGYERATYLKTLDFDRDGNLDIIALTYSPSDLYATGALTVFYGNGSGGVLRKRNLMPIDNDGLQRMFTVADFDRDGKQDIATFTWVQYPTPVYGVQIQYNNGADGFRTPAVRITVPNGGATDMAPGDFDGDGRMDLALVRSGETLAFIQQDANGAYYYQYPSAPLTSNYASVIASDFNGDGFDDLLLPLDSFYGSSVLYMEQSGGYMTAPVHDPLMPYSKIRPGSVAAGDLDGDGCKDVMIGDQNLGWDLRRGIGCLQALEGPVPTFGWRGPGDGIRPPTIVQGGAGAPAQVTAAADPMWIATRSVMQRVWSGFVRSWSVQRARARFVLGSPLPLHVAVFQAMVSWRSAD
jgi:hypothetical protein